MSKRKTFDMAWGGGWRTKPYLEEFDWHGHAFVIHRLLPRVQLYRASHKESGLGVLESDSVSRAETKAMAIAKLDEHPRKTLAAIRRVLAKAKP